MTALIALSPITDHAAHRSQLAIEQATEALKSGDPAESERILRQRLFEAPDDIQVLAKLGDVLVEQGRGLDASVLFKRALTKAPKADSIRLALAVQLEKLGQNEAALKEVEALEGPIRNSFSARALEAALLGKLGRHEPEIAVYEGLIRDFPKHEVLWMCLGNTLKTVGRTKEAVKAFREGIKCRPTYGEIYWCMANLKTFSFDNRDIALMRKALNGRLSDDDALHFHFALGKALEERDQAEESFRHYAAGNALRARQVGNGIVTARVNAAIATFTKEFFEAREGGGCKEPDPIFVVSLQRSGSTLIEQILASHPMIEGTAELMEMERMWERLGQLGAVKGNPFASVAKLERKELEELGREYIERTRAYRLTDRPLFVDKLPPNWLNVGFIRLILPNAKIIDARRHPLACGFSNFRQNYATGVTFSYSLRSIGLFYRDYWRLMNHMDEVQPGAIHHVINERLIENTEAEVRKLLDYVGVPFDPACLEFHKTKRAVHSASSEQVRRPINRDGVDYWRRYEPWLGPLKQALGRALENWDKLPGDQ